MSSQNYVRNDHGAALLEEIILVAAVLVLVGVAVVQSRDKSVSSTTVGATADSVAAGAAQTLTQDAATEMALSADAEAAADEAAAADTDVANLEASFNENGF